MSDNLEVWNKVKRPPKDALKQIKGGRLSGMTDINPMWRYKVITEVYGQVGEGWTYEIVKVWTIPAIDEQIMAFAEILLYVKKENEWSKPIPGIGGSSFIVKEKGGLHINDECFKMAVTDALSVAMKMIGIGADIYAGTWDGSKYIDEVRPNEKYKESAEYSKFQHILDDVCKANGSSGMEKWAAENKEPLSKLSPPELAKFRLYYKDLLASTKEIEKMNTNQKPETVQCPLGGEKTEIDCSACDEKEKCEYGRS